MRRPVLLAPIAALALGACQREAAPPTVAQATSAARETAAAPAVTPAAPAASPAAPPAPSTARDPNEVLLGWAKAISLRDWAAAYVYWGDHGARSGLSAEAFAEKWGRLGQPDLEIGKGRIEGAAGSSFYTVPVTVIDGRRRIRGEVVLRRVNDVPGAGAEQLRWHIVSSTLDP